MASNKQERGSLKSLWRYSKVDTLASVSTYISNLQTFAAGLITSFRKFGRFRSGEVWNSLKFQKKFEMDMIKVWKYGAYNIIKSCLKLYILLRNSKNNRKIHEHQKIEDFNFPRIKSFFSCVFLKENFGGLVRTSLSNLKGSGFSCA